MKSIKGIAPLLLSAYSWPSMLGLQLDDHGRTRSGLNYPFRWPFTCVTRTPYWKMVPWHRKMYVHHEFTAIFPSSQFAPQCCYGRAPLGSHLAAQLGNVEYLIICRYCSGGSSWRTHKYEASALDSPFCVSVCIFGPLPRLYADGRSTLTPTLA